VRDLFAIAAGAAAGALARYGISTWAVARFGTGFPVGTMLINLLGSLLIGAVIALFTTRLSVAWPWRPLLVTGLLGGFTTFSSYSYESYQLLLRGEWLLAAIYTLGSVALGLGAAALGIWLVRFLP
jgi:fluoride exporter